MPLKAGIIELSARRHEFVIAVVYKGAIYFCFPTTLGSYGPDRVARDRLACSR